METPFERLAQVLDNASANYLAAEQRKARLADQRGYDGAVLADARAYEQTQEAKQREQALIAAGYLTKPLGQNTADEISAATANAAKHALAVTEAGDAERAHEAEKRKREAEGWKVNPVKSDARKGMEAEVDGGLLDFGKPAAEMTDEELIAARAKTHADNIKRANAGDDYANQIQAEFLKANKDSDPTPTIAEIAHARAANQPKSSSLADQQMAEQAAQQMAAQIAAQRAAFAMKDRDAIRYLMSDVLKKGHYPSMPAALGSNTDVGTSDTGSTPVPAPPPAAALGLDDEVKRNVISAGIDKDWPQIDADYQIAALGDDAIRERINQPTLARDRLSRGSYSPMVSRPATPAEVAARLEGIRSSQAKAKQRLRKRRGDLALYAPADPERAKQLASILALFPQESAVTQNAFNSVAAKQ